MSKKTKDSVNEYFSHDYHARNDPKLQKLQAKMGHEGKGIYWDIIELLYEQAGKLLVSEIETYAFSIRCEKNAFQNVISDFDLFTDDGEYFWSASVLKRLKLRGIKSAKASKSANKRWEKQDANALRTHSEGIANALPMQSDRNAIKEKKRKEKNIKEYEIKEKESVLMHTPDFENSNFKSSDSEIKPISQPEQKKQTGPGRKRQAAGPVSLEEWGDRSKFDASMPEDWPDGKKDHYWLALLNYSNKGNKYKDWSITAKSWAHKDEKQGSTPWEYSNTSGPKPKESPTQTDDITRIIDEFNALTGSQYDSKDENIRGFLAGRMMDGCQLQDMLDVIALKAVQWGSGDDRKYLKFHILFKPQKYPGYVQEVRDAKAGKIKVLNPKESAYDRIQRKIDAALGRTETA